MKKILLILSSLFLLLSCQQKHAESTDVSLEENVSLFFSSDSTVFGNINVYQSFAVKDSILQDMGFEKQYGAWVKEQIRFIHLTDVAFKIVVEDPQDVEDLKQQIINLPIQKVTKNFLFGIQMKDDQPFQEVFFTEKNGTWELKVFPRNRL